jgi:putative tryptophan/tyrosine transport system substrate-binding protein
MLRTAVFLVALGLGGLVVSLPAAAQREGKIYRIGTLTSAWAPNHPSVEGLRAGLQALGLEEGREVVLEHRYTEGNLKALPEAAAALVAAGADVLFTSGEDATIAAAATAKTAPIVFVNVGDPIASGMVAEVARPGGNVTGVSNLATELVPKRLEILKALVPGVRRAWAIYDATDAPESRAGARKAREAARLLGLELLERPVRTPEELVAALQAVRPGEAFLVLERPTALDIPAQVLQRAQTLRSPTMGSSAFWASHGYLVAYGADYHAVGYQAARLVVKVLRGARPQDLPVEGADKIRLVINLKTARTLGLTVPRSLLLRADQLIQ